MPPNYLTGLALSGARRDDLPGWREAVVSALQQHPTLDLAAEALGVSRRTLNRWLAQDPDLRKGASL